MEPHQTAPLNGAARYLALFLSLAPFLSLRLALFSHSVSVLLSLTSRILADFLPLPDLPLCMHIQEGLSRGYQALCLVFGTQCSKVLQTMIASLGLLSVFECVQGEN